MLKVGLTGGIGSGKSTVSEIIIQKSISVIDADIVSREIYNIYPEVSQKIRYEFGDQYFDENGNLLRRELGNYIFKSRKRREALEAITLPCIIKEIFIRIDNLCSQGEKIAVIDAPTLIEVGLHKAMDMNILVWADEETRIRRIRNRDLLSRQDILNRINSQMSLDEKIKYVDFVIDNGGKLEDTRKQVEAILIKINE
jgi:dephospho-CoA kinase